nr:retrovirus-related Pol polyprotein from transposon 17.6 [Tanacetum cinerariifolium]
MTELLTKFVNTNSASTSSSGTLPSNTIANPISDLKAITTRSGVSYYGPQIPPTPSFHPNVVENKPEATKDTVHPTNNGSTKDVQPTVVQTETLKIKISKPVSEPKLRDKANDQREKFFQIFKDLNFNISFAVALILMPKFGPSIKSLLPNKDKICELARTPLNKHCSALCDFPRMVEWLALADLSASINLMPLSVWNKLSLPDLFPTCLTLELADHSISRPVGVAEDAYVKVGGHTSLEAFLNDDPSPPSNQGNYLPEVRKDLKICEAKSDKSSIDEPPERCMMAIFHDMIEKTVEVFMDDFSVFGNSFQICLFHLEKMLKRCEDTNLCLNWEKSHFMVKHGIVLGHKISKEGIEVDKAKVDVITKLPHPTTVKGIQSFLDHAGFYQRFIKDFSKIARPMTRLLKKDTPFIFSKECVEAFQTLKRKLTEAPILIAPDWDMSFELMCNASDFAIGVVLGQRQD